MAALLVTLAVMDGFRADIQEKILGTQPHVMVLQSFGAPFRIEPGLLETAKKIPGVTASAPYISGQALLQADAKVTGIMLRGINPEDETNITRITSILQEGRWNDLSLNGKGSPPRICTYAAAG